MAASPGDYADLQIHIRRRDEHGYRVDMVVNHQQEFDAGYLPAEFEAWVRSRSPVADGERLFQHLFGSGAGQRAWDSSRGQAPQRRIRLHIDADAPELHIIPWELLREQPRGETPAHDLAADAVTPFSRYLSGELQHGSPIFKRPIKVLVAIAAPDPNTLPPGMAPIDADREWDSLQRALSGVNGIELVRFPPVPKHADLPVRDGGTRRIEALPRRCTLVNLESELQNRCYHVLHIIAHGLFDEEQNEFYLYLADAENHAAPVTGQELVGMLDRQRAGTRSEDALRLVFLASCESASQSTSDTFRGLAPRLIGAGIPAVLAMQGQVPMATAGQFACAFYGRLMAHGLVDLAANEARSAVMTGGMPGAGIPALFMRLRDGKLLGSYGRYSSDREELFWPFLLENIRLGWCTAFLGPRVNTGLLAQPEQVAEKLAEDFHYPLPDSKDLARVAQFLAISDPGLLCQKYLDILQGSLPGYLGMAPGEAGKYLKGKAGLCEAVKALDWAGRVVRVQQTEIHHQLADLKLPLYITTNIDNFMFAALQHRARVKKDIRPRQIGLRWQQPGAGPDKWALKQGPPSRESPVVLHLNGYDGDPEQREHLVLSEDDYLAQYVRLSRDEEAVLPMDVIGNIAEHTLLFLGYDLEDREFREVLHCLVKPIAERTQRAREKAGKPVQVKMHVGVQLDVTGLNERAADRARAYLKRYLGRYNIDIYWGTPQDFVSELHSRWLAEQEAGNGS